MCLFFQVTPTTVTDIFQQIKGKRTKDIPTVQATGSAPLPPQQVLDELFAIAPNAAFFTSIRDPPQDNTTPETPITEDKYPPLLSTLQQADQCNIDNRCDDILSTYSVSQYQADNLESATRNQSVSSLWYQHRMGRVTASKAHDILTRKATTPAANLVKRIAGYSTYDLSKKQQVKWGIDHEEECRQAYTTHQQGQHIGFDCSASGFVINPRHPFLGASPDGITNCTCCGKGTLEIKCPYKHRNQTVQQAAKNDQDFCLHASLHLKTNHRYYTQVQMQMYITNCQYCDFVVYTKCQPAASMIIVRITIDKDFCQKLINKCDSFVKNSVIPELVTRELENQPVPDQEPANINQSDRTWCICSEPEYGRMVRCDGDLCPYEWFHYHCVNVRRKPRGQWFCTSCSV